MTSEPRCRRCSRRTAPLSGRVSLLNREFPRTVPARSSPPPRRSEVKFHASLLPNIILETLKRSNRNRSGARPIGHQGAPATRGAVAAIGSGIRPGGLTGTKLLPVCSMRFTVALSSIVLASAIGLNILALWLTGWFQRNQPRKPVFTWERSIGPSI